MEINITHLADTGVFKFSHSRAKGGENAGTNTWNAALAGPLVNTSPTPEYWQAVRDWIAEFGAWSPGAIKRMNRTELNALLLQFIAGDIREAGANSLEEIDWEVYEAGDNNRGSLYRADNGAFYYSVSN